MVSSFAAGFLGGLGEISLENKRAKELREAQMEQIMEKRRNQLIPHLMKKTQSRTALTGKLKTSESRLLGYGFDKDAVDRILSTGDVENISSFISDLDKGYTAAEEAGRGNQYLETVNTTLENALYQPQQEQPLDMSDLRGILGATADEMPFADELTTTVPGAFGYKPPVYTETRGIDDYTKLEKRIERNARLTANSENNKLNRQISAITKRLESSNLSGEEEATLMEDRAALLSRKQTIGQALDAYSGEEKDAFPLLSIYGTDTVSKVTSDFERFDPSKLLPNLTESIGKAPIAVTNAEQAQRFVQMGILNEGDSVLIDGNIVTIQFEG